MDEVPFPAPLSSQPKTDDRGEVNINFKIPLALKQETKSFCVAKNIKFKDFAAYALKMAIVKHSKPKPETTLKAQISDGTTTLHT